MSKFKLSRSLGFLTIIVLIIAFSSLSMAAEQKTFRIFLPWGIVAAGQSNPMGDAFQAWFDQYTKKHPEANLKFEFVSFNWDNHWDYLRTHAAAGDLPDVICQRVDNGHGYVIPTPEQEADGKSIFLSLDDFMGKTNPYTGTSLNDEYSKVALSKARYNLKHLYYLPISQGMPALIYNEDAFKKAGIAAPPQTASELLADCAKLKGAGLTPIGGPGVAGDGSLVTYFAQYGADSALKSWADDITGKDPFKFDSKKYLNAFVSGSITYKDKRIKGIWDYAKKVAQYYHPATYGRDFNSIWGPFAKGDYAVMPEWSGRFIQAKAAIKNGTAQFKNYSGFSFPIVDKKAVAGSDALKTLAGGSTWGCPFSIAADTVKRGTADAAMDFLWWWASGAQNDICWNQDQPASANGDAPPTKTAVNKWRFKDSVKFLNDEYVDSRGGQLLWPNAAVGDKIYQYAKAYLMGQIKYDEFATAADKINKAEAKTLLDQLQ